MLVALPMVAMIVMVRAAVIVIMLMMAPAMRHYDHRDDEGDHDHLSDAYEV